MLPFRVVKLILAPMERRILHDRIRTRFQLMLEQGFIAEVERLRARGDLDLTKPSMRAVGYRQVWEYLDGLLDRVDMIERAVVATRQFAKRRVDLAARGHGGGMAGQRSAAVAGAGHCRVARTRVFPQGHAVLVLVCERFRPAVVSPPARARHLGNG